MKNPRFKQKAQETYLKYALRINIDHMASLLYVLHELYPKTFTKSNIQKYINDHADTVAALECGGDKLLKEHKIRQLCESCNYISRELADDITAKMKAKAPREKLRFFLDNGQLYADNILLMLLTLHYDFGFGEKRIMATVEAWTSCPKTDCIEWLDTYADAQIEDSDKVLRHGVKEVERQKRLERAAPKVTVREEFEARRKLEALRAYQERMMAHEKS